MYDPPWYYSCPGTNALKVERRKGEQGTPRRNHSPLARGLFDGPFHDPVGKVISPWFLFIFLMSVSGFGSVIPENP